ncbi:MAG: DUF3574 domain-containing protein [Clostridia bacterium]|nr:DUF3574 domain-containing protein [Clostridia bacterium]
MMKKIATLLILLLLCAASVFALADSQPALLSEYWTEDSAAAESLNAYLLAVTDEASPDFIPVSDRIAVFDLDGTLMCETYPFCFEYMVFADYAMNSGSDTITDAVRAVAQEILDAAGGEKPSGMSTRQAGAGAIAYQGMTMEELADMVRVFKDSEAMGFTGLKRGDAYYKPMLELFDKLLKNDFTVYIVTATERNIVREVIRGTLDIPPSHVIGTEYGYTATSQGEMADTDYTFQPIDQVVFDGSYNGENAKTSKVDAIVREIGQQPVLAFGNSSGDLAMEIYTISNNSHRSAAYMVVADDEEREYGNADSAAEKKADYESMGIGVISMRDDFATIYGDGVKKTEIIQTVKENTEDEAPAATEPAPTQEEMSGNDDVQYVLYLGTNDKDTNRPVFTQAEAMEKARAVLIRLFGGYTIQEAHGGWIGDDGTEYQEYTLVIYLSDTTEAQVHAAADELISVFHQSSILIQANPTKTDFYSSH